MQGLPMFSRFISSLLIAAVVACPLSCEAGLVRCCAGESTSASAEKSELPACCQKRETCPDVAPAFPDEPPADEPEQCQGICGGAVLEKPYQIDASDQVALIPPESFALISAVGQLEQPLLSDACPPPCYSGRMLRTLHSSLLC